MSDETTELEKKSDLPEPGEDESGKMSFLEHLDELRKRLLHIAAYLFGGCALCLFFWKDIYNFLSVPVVPYLPEGQLVFSKIQAPFNLMIKVAFLGGIFLTIPGTLFEVWKFIAPGLYQKEKRYVVPFLFFSVLLFLLGSSFCYFIALPAAYQWLLNLGRNFTPLIDVMGYLDITIMMLIGFGLTFEMPVVITFLSLFGLVSAKFLFKNFKYAILIIVIIAAIMSPTADAINLLIWSGPMVLLYFFSICIAFIIEKRRKKRASA
ncbi:MAG: twin-arginine translocase subunit TatC [Acidobacteria bacterium]|nr:twin-arginine translocase subunit TatC [Acidobacteriota bacterium]